MRERESEKEEESANTRAREREKHAGEKSVCETGRRGGEETAYQGDFPGGADDQ